MSTSVRTYELGHVFQPGMSGYHVLPPFQRFDVTRHGDRVTAANVTVASDVILTSTHAGTHVDALAHVADATDGLAADTWADSLPAFMARGIVVDVSHEFQSGGGTSITALMVENALAASELDVEPGDVILLRTGWEDRWTEAGNSYGADLGSMPGLDLQAAQMLIERGAVAIGADTPTLEASSNGWTVHRYLLQESRAHIFENLHLNDIAGAKAGAFLFLALPLRIAGGTASPVRPIAVTGLDKSVIDALASAPGSPD